jgi:hypothetical protein
MKNNCAFQYYHQDGTIICDETGLTVEEAKGLFNDHYPDMISKVKRGVIIEVAVYVNGKDQTSYGEKLIHLSDPEIEESIFGIGHTLFETSKTYYRPF